VVLHGAIVKSAGRRGHASDGGADAVLRLAIPVDSILPRCPCICVEEYHMRSSTRFLGAFSAHLQWDVKLRGKGLFVEKRSVLWAAMVEEDNNNAVNNRGIFPKISRKGPTNHLRMDRSWDTPRQAPIHTDHIKFAEKKHWSTEVLAPSRMIVSQSAVDEEGLVQRFGDTHMP
jgi:hypothetical protein